ncbi:MAG TPA: hypothetical protein VLK23_15305 [Thermodesulfobacteriota bacterium]|nr:hypothetical protein [Thermodesulfobacteriota bacterium]
MVDLEVEAVVVGEVEEVEAVEAVAEDNVIKSATIRAPNIRITPPRKFIPCLSSSSDVFIDFSEVFGKSKRKSTSFSINAVDPYLPAIGLHNGLDNPDRLEKASFTFIALSMSQL